ncbi:unnamed protein product, partial [Ixodes pacificus]
SVRRCSRGLLTQRAGFSHPGADCGQRHGVDSGGSSHWLRVPGAFLEDVRHRRCSLQRVQSRRVCRHGFGELRGNDWQYGGLHFEHIQQPEWISRSHGHGYEINVSLCQSIRDRSKYQPDVQGLRDASHRSCKPASKISGARGCTRILLSPNKLKHCQQGS